MKLTDSAQRSALGILVAGDVIAWLAWIVVGLASHSMYESWLLNLSRVAAPFLIAWFVIAPVVGAYRQVSRQSRRRLLARSALAWLLATSLGLLLRRTLFGEGFVPIFALVTFTVTALFVLGWRALFAWIFRD